jgi:membrane associated rhomboid family serine protease
VLAAVGIPANIVYDGHQFLLEVNEVDALRAVAHLTQYEAERRGKPAAAPALPSHPQAWVGCVIYVLTLIAIGLLISNGFWRLDAFDTGELDAARVRNGQWWRAWTALTLHRDGTHLTANLAAGVWIGYLAARQIGSGLSWLLIVTGAAAANLLEALLGPASHRSVGASTAVFTALGLLSAHSWRLRAREIRHWAFRWAPMVAGVVLLSWFGAGDSDASGAGGTTDIVAHVLGFLMGVLLGVWIAQQHAQSLARRVPQWLAGVAAIASIAIAWTCALIS